MTLDTGTILMIALALSTIILAALVIRLEYKMRRFLVHKGAYNIEDVLNGMKDDVKDLEAFRKELETYLAHVEKRLRRSVQGVHTVRFDPFKGTGSGGKQSFATALITEEGNGVIISSLYSREHVSIFSKPLRKHESDFELTAEEKDAVIEARKAL